MAPRKKSKRKVLTPLQKAQKKLRKDIQSTLKAMGFEYLRTEGKHIEFGGQKGEFDSIYLYENILLLCEDTVVQDIKGHIKKKHIFFEQIENNRTVLLDWLNTDYSEKISKFVNYQPSRYKIFFVYFHTQPIDTDTKNVFKYINFVYEYDLNYFKTIASSLKYTARNELFRFLGIGLHEVGIQSSTKLENTIDTAVILPEETSGFPDGIKLVSFLMCAEDLMDCAYVLRKEDWETRIQLYQRLIVPGRINKIREFIANNGRTFVNNVIVSLPSDVKFYRKDSLGNEIQIDQDSLSNIENMMISIPKVINSICIIDGQHRIFAHYKAEDKFEHKISDIRKQRHLLVTGLLFPKNMRKEDKIKFESEIFLQINSNQKIVDPALLQHIESIKDPYSAIGIARKVLTLLNERDPFLNKFQVYSFETKKIKTPSIIKWGLKDLVEINEENTLFAYWNHDDKNILLNDKSSDKFDEVYNEYLQFCARIISQYFNAVKTNFNDSWTIDKKFKLLSVTSITGFVISLRMSLEVYKKVHDFHFYQDKFKKLNIDFSKGEFGYTSSHWHRFAEEVKNQCWK